MRKLNKPKQPLVVADRFKNLERQMEASRAWPNELGPHYDDKTGLPQKTQREFRIEEENRQRVQDFKRKVAKGPPKVPKSILSL